MSTNQTSFEQQRPYGSLLVTADPDDLARKAADRIFDWASEKNGLVFIALSGGDTPRRTYQQLAGERYLSRFPWPRVHWYWGDERFVSSDDKQSNYRMVREALFDVAPVPPGNVHPIPTAGISPNDAAAEYERLLRRMYTEDGREPGAPLFDICLLGLGKDGHTASLIPRAPALDDTLHWVAVVAGRRPETRITLTYSAINLSRHVVFLVSGSEKRAILRAVTAGSSTVPAARLHPLGDIVFIADSAAAGASPPAMGGL